MGPINILEDFTKPLSLSFRLFGNVLADELTVAVLTFLVPFVVPLPIMALGIFAGSIQALIFATLASAYIAEACEGSGLPCRRIGLRNFPSRSGRCMMALRSHFWMPQQFSDVSASARLAVKALYVLLTARARRILW